MSEQKQKKSAGKRPQMGSLDKAMARAARAYHKLREANSKTEADYESERIQFAKTDGSMGRPAFKVDKSKGHRNQFHAEMMVTREKALEEWNESLKEYRDLEEKFGVDPVPEADIHSLQKHTKVGRPGADRVDKLKKYVRRETRRIADIQAEIDSGVTEPEHVRGRKPIPRDEKKQQYQKRVDEAQHEVNKLIAAMPRSEQIKHELNDLRVESRQLTVFIATPEHKQNKSIDLDPHNPAHQQIAADRQAELKQQIATLEPQHKEALAQENLDSMELMPAPSGTIDLGDTNPVPANDASLADEIKRVENECKVAEARNELLKQQLARLKALKEQEELEAQIREFGGDPNAG